MRGMPRAQPGKPAPATPEVMTIDDLAAYLQVSKSSLYKLAQEGKVPGHKVGKHWRFHRVTIDQWLRDESTASAPRRDSKGRS